MGGAVSIGIQLVSNPVTSLSGLLIAANAALLGFGVWWSASALQVLGAVNLGCCGVALANHRCFRFVGGILTTLLLIAPIVTGAIGVAAYSCLRECGGLPGVSYQSGTTCDADCGLDRTTFTFDIDLPFWTWFIPGANDVVNIAISIINSIPEGLCYANVALGGLAVVVSVFWWNLSSLFSFLNTPVSFGSSPTTETPEMPLLTLPRVQSEKGGEKAKTVV